MKAVLVLRNPSQVVRATFGSHRCAPVSSAAGQTLPLVVLFMGVLIAMSGLVIDLGNGYVQKRSTQNVAGAGALAGAATIPQGTWQATAQQNAASNDMPGDQVSTSLSGGDT